MLSENFGGGGADWSDNHTLSDSDGRTRPTPVPRPAPPERLRSEQIGGGDIVRSAVAGVKEGPLRRFRICYRAYGAIAMRGRFNPVPVPFKDEGLPPRK